LEQVADHSAFDWIARGLDLHGFGIARLLPPVFSAYRKILHVNHVDLSVTDRSLSWHQAAGRTRLDRSAAPDTPEDIPTKEIVEGLVSRGMIERGVPEGPFPNSRVRWRDLATQYSVDFTPQITDAAFTAVFPGRSWPRYLVGPHEGTLDEEGCRRLCEILAPLTGTQRCFFYYELIATRSMEALLYSGHLDEVSTTCGIEAAQGTPRLLVAGRSSLVRLHGLGPHVHRGRRQR